jgi:hypothetical protein
MITTRRIVQEKFDGVIWRLELDEVCDTLFAEVRHSDDKKVTFSALSIKTGQLYFKDLQLPERWLTGMEAAFDGVLLLHGYQSEKSPIHKGITAVDASSGDVLWSNYNLTFDHLTVNGPIVYDSRIQPGKFFLIDMNKGDKIRSYDPKTDQIPVSRITVPNPAVADGIFLPYTAYGNSILVEKYNDLIIVSLHTQVHDLLEQKLLVMDDNTVVFEDLLNHGIQKMQPEAFIRFDSHLIYVKSKSEINILTL